jgi:hypothetical protein
VVQFDLINEDLSQATEWLIIITWLEALSIKSGDLKSTLYESASKE